MTLDFWDTWGMFQGSGGIFLDGESLSSFTYTWMWQEVSKWLASGLYSQYITLEYIYLKCFGTAMYCP